MLRNKMGPNKIAMRNENGTPKWVPTQIIFLFPGYALLVVVLYLSGLDKMA